MEGDAAKRREGFLGRRPAHGRINSYLIAHRDHPVCTHEIADYALRQEFTQKLAKDISAILTDQCPGWRFDGKRKCGPYGQAAVLGFTTPGTSPSGAEVNGRRHR